MSRVNPRKTNEHVTGHRHVGRAIIICKSTLTGHHGGESCTVHHELPAVRFLIRHQSLVNFLFPITPSSSRKGYKERAHRSICEKSLSQRLYKAISRSHVGGGCRACLQRPPTDMLRGSSCKHSACPLLSCPPSSDVSEWTGF